MHLIVRLSLAALWQRRGHAAILAVAVALGAALVIAIHAVNASALASLRETVAVQSGEARLRVDAGDSVSEDTLERLRAVPGVATASPVVSGVIWVTDGPAKGEMLSVFGVDLGDEQAIRMYRLSGENGTPVIEDPLLFLARADSVVLTASFTRRFALAAEGTLAVVGPRGAGTLTARGVLADDGLGRLFGGNLVVMDFYAAQRLLSRTGGADHVDVAVAEGEDVSVVAARVKSSLPGPLEVATPKQHGAFVERLLLAFRSLLNGLSGLGLLFGAFVSYNVAATATTMRRGELGMLRCVGASRRQIRMLVIAETVPPALVGSLLGLGVGVLLGNALCDSLTHTLSYAVRIALPHGQGVGLPLEAVPLAIAGSLGAAVLGAWGPAAGAARSRFLRAETDRDDGPGARLVAAGAVAIVAAWASIAGATRYESPVLAGAAIVLLHAALICLGLVALPRISARLHMALVRCGAYGSVAGDALMRAPMRASVTVTVLASALAVTLLIGSVVASFKGSVLDFLRGLVQADLVVSSPFREEAWIEAPITETVADEVATIPGVARVAGERFAHHVQDSDRLVIRSVDRAFFDEGRFGRLPFREGDAAAAFAAVAAGEGILVSDVLAERRGLRLGDPFALDAPEGRLRLPVVGIVVDYASEIGTVILRRETYVASWRDRVVNHVLVLTAPGVSLAGVRTEIGHHFAGRFPLQVITAREYRAGFEHDLDGVFAFLWGLRVAVIVIAALGMADTLLGLGLARAREVGVLRALGARRRGIYGLFFLEAVLPTGFGILLGMAGAAALSAAWVRLLTYQLGWHVNLHLNALDYLALALATWVVASVGGASPVAALVRRAPATLLGNE